jgi:hypothetical protein
VLTQAVTPPEAPAAATVDLESQAIFRNRNLGALHRKLAVRVGQRGHVPSVLQDASSCAEAAAVEGLSFGVQVRDLWALDGKKGTRARRKKALTDYLKCLASLGAVLCLGIHLILGVLIAASSFSVHAKLLQVDVVEV